MIRKAIEEGKVKDAQEKLHSFFNFIEKAKSELLNQTGQANLLGEKVQSGILRREDESVETNRLIYVTQQFCHRIEKKLPEYFPEIKFDFTPESLDEQLKRKLNGKYDELEKITDGDSATFFRGTDSDTKRKVIIRILNDFRAEDNKSKSSISNDRRLERSLKIKHRNIIRVLGADLKSVPKVLGTGAHRRGIPGPPDRAHSVYQGEGFFGGKATLRGIVPSAYKWHNPQERQAGQGFN